MVEMYLFVCNYMLHGHAGPGRWPLERRAAGQVEMGHVTGHVGGPRLDEMKGEKKKSHTPMRNNSCDAAMLDRTGCVS